MMEKMTLEEIIKRLKMSSNSDGRLCYCPDRGFDGYLGHHSSCELARMIYTIELWLEMSKALDLVASVEDNRQGEENVIAGIMARHPSAFVVQE